MAEDFDKQLLANATAPKSAEIDGQKVEQHSLKDQIEVDKYLASKRAIRNKNSGLKFNKMSHGGA